MEGVANPARRPVHFAVGSKAWLSTAHLPVRVGTRKLAAKWAGPFRVLKEVAPEAYQLELPTTWRLHDVFHASQLKEVSADPGREQAVILEDGEEEFEVERILAERVVKGQK